MKRNQSQNQVTGCGICLNYFHLVNEQFKPTVGQKQRNVSVSKLMARVSFESGRCAVQALGHMLLPWLASILYFPPPPRGGVPSPVIPMGTRPVPTFLQVKWKEELRLGRRVPSLTSSHPGKALEILVRIGCSLRKL